MKRTPRLLSIIAGVVLCAGVLKATLPQTEIGTWTSAASLWQARSNASAVMLSDDRILIAGGADQPEVYDPASGAFLPVAGAKLDAFCFSTATPLNDGKVLLAGGYANPGGPGVNHAWLYQP